MCPCANVVLVAYLVVAYLFQLIFFCSHRDFLFYVFILLLDHRLKKKRKQNPKYRKCTCARYFFCADAAAACAASATCYFHCTLKTVERFMIFRKRDAYTITQENGHTDARSHACILAATTTTKKGRRIVVDNKNSVINFHRWLATFVSDNNSKCPRHFGGQIHRKSIFATTICTKTVNAKQYGSIRYWIALDVLENPVYSSLVYFALCPFHLLRRTMMRQRSWWKFIFNALKNLCKMPFTSSASAGPHETIRNRAVCAQIVEIAKPSVRKTHKMLALHRDLFGNFM